MSRALLKPCSEGQEALMLREGEAPAVPLPSQLPAGSPPATLDASGCASWRAVGSRGDLMASALWSLALLKSSHPKGHRLPGAAAAEVGPVPSKAGTSSGRMTQYINTFFFFFNG